MARYDLKEGKKKKKWRDEKKKNTIPSIECIEWQAFMERPTPDLNN